MSWTLWISGPPASGKSTLARAAAAALAARGIRVVLLDPEVFLDASADTTYGERTLVYRSLVWIARVLADAGVPVVVDATDDRREWRDLARAALPRVAEVQLRCPLDVCRRREAQRPVAPAPGGVCRRPARLDLPHEPSLTPELDLDTGRLPVAAAVERVVALAERLGPAPAAGAETGGHAWTVWITGLPGSGKTTIARAVAAALADAGTTVALLELTDLRAFVVGDRLPSRQEEGLLHQVLVLAARRLTEAGVPVLVDATAQRRLWREQARRALRRFAEVQLLCPPAVCASRERAARWGLGSAVAEPAARRATPEIVLEYEVALRPEVVIHTDVEDVWTATETVLVLVRRLREDGTPAARETVWTPTTRD